MKDTLLAGKIVTTHGIRGEVKVYCHTDSPDFFNNIKKVILMPGESEMAISSARAHKNAALIKLKGVDTVNDAERFINKEIYVYKKDVKLPEGRYFIDDILGMAVITEEGETLGKVTDVFPTGSNDVFEVELKGKKKAYIPHIKDIVKDINIETKEIKIFLMEGLIDEV